MEQYEILTQIAQRYGLALGQLAGAGALVAVLVQAFKGMIPSLTGWLIVIPVLAFSFGLAAAAHQPDAAKILVSGSFISLSALGIWGGAKRLLANGT